MSKIVQRNIRNILAIFCFFYFLKTQAQLGFCTGNSGDPIFEETFGVGTNFGNFPTGSTSTYRNISGRPQNGYCTISSRTYGWHKWFNISDHTSGDNNGRMLIVNADRNPGEFFRIAVSGLCENTSYEFSSWIINLLPASFMDCGYNNKPIPINVSFEIWDSTNTKKLKSGSTGNIYSSSKPNWQQYALLFQTRPGQTSVILKIRNNGVGGCGNDLALDDIVFKPCGDTVVIKDTEHNESISVSKDNLPFSRTLSATPDFSVFSTHAYQWQESKDGMNWIDINGETKQTYTIKISTINASEFYRVRVAEDAVNLSNTSCYSNSEFFKVKIVEPKKPKIIKPKIIKPKVIVKRPKIKKANSITPESLANVNVSFSEEKIMIPIVLVDKEKLAKTYKKIIIVKDGLKIIYDKVWVDGAIGKFIQTSEEVTRQGDDNGIVVVDETIYYKGVYGYNSKTRRYRIE